MVDTQRHIDDLEEYLASLPVPRTLSVEPAPRRRSLLTDNAHSRKYAKNDEKIPQMPPIEVMVARKDKKIRKLDEANRTTAAAKIEKPTKSRVQSSACHKRVSFAVSHGTTTAAKRPTPALEPAPNDPPGQRERIIPQSAIKDLRACLLSLREERRAGLLQPPWSPSPCRSPSTLWGLYTQARHHVAEVDLCATGEIRELWTRVGQIQGELHGSGEPLPGPGRPSAYQVKYRKTLMLNLEAVPLPATPSPTAQNEPSNPNR